MRTTTSLLSLLGVLILAPISMARASESELPPNDPANAAGGKRALPDYDGRPDAGASVGEALVWVPRVVLFPVHAVAEYGLRRPLVGAVTWSDEHYLMQRTRRLFTSDDGKRGVYPYFLIDTGLRPRAGVVAFADSLLSADNDARVSGSFARTQAFSVTAQDSTRLGRARRTALIVRSVYATADDNRFYGLGPAGAQAGASGAAFALRRIDESVQLERSLGGLSRAALQARLRDARFGASRFGGTSGADLMSSSGGPGQPPLPPGWGGYRLLSLGGKLILDSRDPSLDHLAGATGVRLEMNGALAGDATQSDLRFADWGGELAGFVDVTGRENVFGARVAARFQENIGGAPVPFTERPALGGAETMRGFTAGRLRGDSTFLAELQYRYTIAAYVDAELFSGVGNAFDGHLRGIEPGALLWTSGLSLRTTFSRDTSWGAGIAMASDRLDSSSFNAADNVRFFAGLNQGF